MLDSSNNERIKAEKKIRFTLKEFTGDAFEKNIWKQTIDKQRHPRTTIFSGLTTFDEKWVYLAKLWVILESKASGRLYVGATYIKSFFLFLHENDLTLKNITKKSLLQFQEWLNNYQQEDSSFLAAATKYTYYDAALRFLSLMQKHPWINTINDVLVMSNPYPSKSTQNGDNNKNRSKVIPSEKLKILDSHFRQESVPLHYRTAYWLMRLKGIRPYDTASFPLECVKQLKDDLATMIAYVGKQTGAQEKIDPTLEHPYKMEFLNLNEPMQKMLFDLIKKQQEISKSLQRKALKKGFLFTYEYKKQGDRTYVATMSYDNFSSKYWHKYVRPLFPVNECPTPRSLRHTAATERHVWGGYSHIQLRDFLNHQGFGAVDNYVKPNKDQQNNVQEKILMYEGKYSKNSFKGQSVHSLKNIEHIMEDPYAHKLPGFGYCPDARGCGNHFFCLDCDFLVPDIKLRSYYFEQAEVYIAKSDKLTEIGRHQEADDRMETAAQFYRLYKRSFDEGLEVNDDQK